MPQTRHERERESSARLNPSATTNFQINLTKTNKNHTNCFLPYFAKAKQNFLAKYLILAIFLFIFCGILVSFCRYTFNLDDIWMWLKIYDKSLILDQQFNQNIGRFWILGLMDLNLLMQISNSPYFFFCFNALCVIVFAISYTKILHLTNINHFQNQLITIAICLSYGFCVVNFGICYPERNLIVFISLFMLATFFVVYHSNKFAFCAGILALNVAIYLKEPVFISAFVIGVILFIGSFKSDKFAMKYSLAICASSITYAILYLILIFPYRGIKTYGRYTQNTDIALENLRGILNYAINDGLVVIFLSALALRRIYGIWFKGEKFQVFFDAFLAGAVVYFLVFVKLGIFESYYLLPCYVFGAVSVLYFRKYLKNIFIKIAFIVGIFGFVTSNIPSGIYTMINLKAMGVQFHQALAKSADYINSRKHTNIYFEGIGRGREIYAEWYASYFGEYLEKLYDAKNFDLHTKEPNLKDFTINKNHRWSFKNTLTTSAPKSGDLLILNNTSVYNSKIDLNKYELFFTSDFPTMPYIALKPILKYLNMQFFGVKHNILGHQNIFKFPLRTYIFIAK